MREKIAEILAEINDETEGYAGENMLEDEIITSLDVIEIVSELEDSFDIKVAAKDITKENFATVDSIADLVNRLK